MSKTPNDQLLFELIKSLTKSEKRSFKLFATRNGGDTDAKYIRLFDVLDKMDSYDEKAILKKLKGVSKTQFSNQKSHLYGQVLSSLRLSHLKVDIDIELREQLDYIRVLYKKGLYFQSLRLLSRAKKITGNYRKDLFQLALLDYEKQIRSQQVFDLEEDYAKLIDEETDQAMDRFNRVQKLFSLASRMKARFVEKGMVKSEQEMNNLKALFYRNLPEHNEELMAFNERFYLYRAFYWFSYLTYDFENCVKYAEKWVLLFQETGLDKKRKAGYLKGLNRLLQSAFRVEDREKFVEYYDELINFEKQEKPLASNTQHLLLKYKVLQSLNRLFLITDFDEQQDQLEALLAQTEKERSFIDKHNLLVIYYKAGVFFFAQQNYSKATYYFTQLIQDKDKLRTDLKGFARMMLVLIDFDSGDEQYLDRRVKAAYLHFDQHKSLTAFKEIFLDFIGNADKIYPQDLKKQFKALKLKMERLEGETFTKKLQLYFDLMSWLDAKIEGKTFKEIVQRKAIDA